MAALWKIYREHEILGPMTAADVRQALREGAVDPFDMVGKEGSNLRVELLEADEIFDMEGPGFSGPSIESTQINPLAASIPAVAAPVNKPVAGFYERIKAKYRTGRPKPLARNKQSAPSAGQNKASPKVFFLIDRQQRTLGPISASEILSLFYRGILDRSVRVQRDGTKKSLPISKFISAYAGQRIHDLSGGAVAAAQRRGKPDRGGLVYAQPSSKVLNELSRGIAARHLATTSSKESYLSLVSLLGLGVLLGVLVFVLAQTRTVQSFVKGRGDKPTRSSAVSYEEEVPLVDKADTRKMAAPSVNKGRGKIPSAMERPKTPRLSRPNRLDGGAAGDEAVPSAGRVTPALPRKVRKPAKRQDEQVVSTRPRTLGLAMAKDPQGLGRRATPVAPPPVASLQDRGEKAGRQAIRAAPATPPMRVERREGNQSAIPSRVSPKLAAKTAPSKNGDVRSAGKSLTVNRAPVKPEASKAAGNDSAAKSSRSGALDDIDSKVGQTSSLGPLRFSPQALSSCDIKCKLTFKDSKGKTITGIFFKDAYADSLKAAGGRVTLIGTVRKEGSGYSMIISGVQ